MSATSPLSKISRSTVPRERGPVLTPKNGAPRPASTNSVEPSEIVQSDDEPSKATRRRTDGAPAQPVVELVPTVQPLDKTAPKPAPPTDELSKEQTKTALDGWQVKQTQSGVHYSRLMSGDRLVDEGSRVTAQRGSPEEVKGMFALARAKNWQSMAFSGSDAFKREVMKAALENNCIVKAVSDHDKQMFAEVERAFKAKQSPSKTPDGPAHDGPAPKPARDERSNPNELLTRASTRSLNADKTLTESAQNQALNHSSMSDGREVQTKEISSRKK